MGEGYCGWSTKVRAYKWGQENSCGRHWPIWDPLFLPHEPPDKVDASLILCGDRTLARGGLKSERANQHLGLQLK